jgi:hypothetical protein
VIEIGSVFGRLTVIAKLPDRKIRCLCKCGQEKVIFEGNLTRGVTKSCGCLNAELSAKRNLKHGGAKRGKLLRAYRSYHHMKYRCLNPNATGYQYWGGRGITICERWLESFDNFYADLGERPKGYELDRINPNGNYEPNNCQWIVRGTGTRTDR